MQNGNLEIEKMEILKNKQDIREFPIFKNYMNWELSTKSLHRDRDTLNRNLYIFISYLGKSQNLTNIALDDLGHKYCLNKERIRQIYTKHLLRFILYIYYICKPRYRKNGTDIFSMSINLLSDADKNRLLKHLEDGKPFKLIGPKDLLLIKRTCKIL